MSGKDLLIRNSTAEFLSFTAASGADSIEVLYANENVWATQDMMAALYDIDRSGIAKHLKNIFESGELNKDSVCAKFAQTEILTKRNASHLCDAKHFCICF